MPLQSPLEAGSALSNDVHACEQVEEEHSSSGWTATDSLPPLWGWECLLQEPAIINGDRPPTPSDNKSSLFDGLGTVNMTWPKSGV
jgi:hypothetical protein